jgi:hypothetical protein
MNAMGGGGTVGALQSSLEASGKLGAMLSLERPSLRRGVDVDDTQRPAMILADARIKKPMRSRRRRRI